MGEDRKWERLRRNLWGETYSIQATKYTVGVRRTGAEPRRNLCNGRQTREVGKGHKDVTSCGSGKREPGVN